MVGWFLPGSSKRHLFFFGDHFQGERMVTCRDFHFVIVHRSGFFVLFPDPCKREFVMVTRGYENLADFFKGVAFQKKPC